MGLLPGRILKGSWLNKLGIKKVVLWTPLVRGQRSQPPAQQPITAASRRPATGGDGGWPIAGSIRQWPFPPLLNSQILLLISFSRQLQSPKMCFPFLRPPHSPHFLLPFPPIPVASSH